jgi:hypothetical protein
VRESELALEEALPDSVRQLSAADLADGVLLRWNEQKSKLYFKKK